MTRKILQISKYYYPFIGGTEQVARDIINALKDEDYEQKIICFNEDAQDSEYICHRKETVHDHVDGVEVIRCGYSIKLFSQSISLGYARELKKVMNTFQPDIVIFHYPNPFVSTLLMKYLKGNCKFVVYYHLDIVKQKYIGKLFHKQTLSLLEKANIIISTSPNYIEGSQYLSQFKTKCHIIPNCIDTERLQVTPAIEKKAKQIRENNKDKIICFGIGRHVPYKGMTYLVQASQLLDDRFVIYIGGKGPLTESLMNDAKNDDKVHFLGRIDDEDLIAYLKTCDIFCFPSITKNEAFGIALAEGMYFGKPAVTFNISGSGVNYVNLDRVTGIECANKDIEEYAEALIKLGNDKKLREEYGKQARQRVEKYFLNVQFKENILTVIK